MWACHSLLFSALFSPPWQPSERASKKESDGEGVKESFSLIQWSNLSRGPPHALIPALCSDKIFEQSLLSIYFLTVQTYTQSDFSFCRRSEIRLDNSAHWGSLLTQVDWSLLRGVCYGLLSHRCEVQWRVWWKGLFSPLEEQRTAELLWTSWPKVKMFSDQEKNTHDLEPAEQRQSDSAPLCVCLHAFSRNTDSIRDLHVKGEQTIGVNNSLTDFVEDLIMMSNETLLLTLQYRSVVMTNLGAWTTQSMSSVHNYCNRTREIGKGGLLRWIQILLLIEQCLKFPSRGSHVNVFWSGRAAGGKCQKLHMLSNGWRCVYLLVFYEVAVSAQSQLWCTNMRKQIFTNAGIGLVISPGP